MCDEFTYPFLNYNGCTIEFEGFKSNFIPHFIGHVITYPCWDKSETMLQRRLQKQAPVENKINVYVHGYLQEYKLVLRCHHLRHLRCFENSECRFHWCITGLITHHGERDMVTSIFDWWFNDNISYLICGHAVQSATFIQRCKNITTRLQFHKEIIYYVWNQSDKQCVHCTRSVDTGKHSRARIIIYI